MPVWLRRLFPVVAFFAGFVLDALTLGRRVGPIDFWQLGAYLLGAAALAWGLARRSAAQRQAPADRTGWRGRVAYWRWQAPYLLIQFFFGSIFSALFIFYSKSAAHLGAWLTATVLGVLLVANEFAGDRYGRRFTLTWALFALNAMLLLNFVLPHLAGSLAPGWFYVSTATGALLAHGLYRYAPGRPGRIVPVWCVAVSLLAAWHLGMIAPVPLVKRELMVGHDFVQTGGRYVLQVEEAPWWAWWRGQSAQVHVRGGERLYGVSAVFAPQGVAADLEHRWELLEPGGWRLVYRSAFRSTGGREGGFRGYSWVNNPVPGVWRLTVATQDGRTIGILRVEVVRTENGVDGVGAGARIVRAL